MDDETPCREHALTYAHHCISTSIIHIHNIVNISLGIYMYTHAYIHIILCICMYVYVDLQNYIFF